MRTERWSASEPWADPDRPTTLPRSTRAPRTTSTAERYETDTFRSLFWIVIDRIPATEPAKVTVPARGARTAVPAATPRSTPQWPA